MPDYRFYLLDSNGLIIRESTDVQCLDDGIAFTVAGKMVATLVWLWPFDGTHAAWQSACVMPSLSRCGSFCTSGILRDVEKP